MYSLNSWSKQLASTRLTAVNQFIKSYPGTMCEIRWSSCSKVVIMSRSMARKGVATARNCENLPWLQKHVILFTPICACMIMILQELRSSESIMVRDPSLHQVFGPTAGVLWKVSVLWWNIYRRCHVRPQRICSQVYDENVKGIFTVLP